MDESERMWREGCARRSAQRLQTGEGYARGGRVAMDRVLGKASVKYEAPVERAPAMAPRSGRMPRPRG